MASSRLPIKIALHICLNYLILYEELGRNTTLHVVIVFERLALKIVFDPPYQVSQLIF